MNMTSLHLNYIFSNNKDFHFSAWFVLKSVTMASHAGLINSSITWHKRPEKRGEKTEYVFKSWGGFHKILVILDMSSDSKV